MPKTIAPDRRYGARPWTQHQAQRAASSSSAITSIARAGRFVEVAVGAWTPDDALYPNAPIAEWGTNGMIAYADVLHGLGTRYAVALAWSDADGWIYAQQTFVAQTPTPGNEANSLRVWLDPTPTDTITVYVAAFG